MIRHKQTHIKSIAQANRNMRDEWNNRQSNSTPAQYKRCSWPINITRVINISVCLFSLCNVYNVSCLRSASRMTFIKARILEFIVCDALIFSLFYYFALRLVNAKRCNPCLCFYVYVFLSSMNSCNYNNFYWRINHRTMSFGDWNSKQVRTNCKNLWISSYMKLKNYTREPKENLHCRYRKTPDIKAEKLI